MGKLKVPPPPATTTIRTWNGNDYETRETCTVAEARKFLSSPEVIAQATTSPAKINPRLQRRHVYDILMKAMADDPPELELNHHTYRNMMREFGGMKRR
jgi:hypothetical protein